MNAVLLRYYPHNENKVFQQRFEDVKLKAGTYIYSQHDRVKKLCSTIDKTIDTFKLIDKQQLDNLQMYQIILIDPTQLQIMDAKQHLLKLGMQKLQQRINMYTDYITKMGKTLQHLSAKRRRYIKKQEKLAKEKQCTKQ